MSVFFPHILKSIFLNVHMLLCTGSYNVAFYTFLTFEFLNIVKLYIQGAKLTLVLCQGEELFQRSTKPFTGCLNRREM